MPSVLIIDDSELILQMLQMVCAQAGFETRTATDLASAKDLFDREGADVVITDLNMPGADDTVATVRSWKDVPVVIVSGQPQADLDAIAAERGAAGAVSKDAGMMGMAAVLPELLGRLVG